MGEQVSETDAVTLDGKPLTIAPPKVYIKYYKPAGITCTTEGQVKGNIIDAVKHPHRVFPIGRLDKDSTGLILLTNDGDIVNRILRVEYGHEKEYTVELGNSFDENFLKKMGSGVDIGDHVTLPCKVQKIKNNTFGITLTEGKNRQIRRMCEALGYKVRKLHRHRIMNIKLDDLKEGQWTDLSPSEISELKRLVN